VIAALFLIAVAIRPAEASTAGSTDDAKMMAQPAAAATYTVQPGDTLSSIAAGIGVSPADTDSWILAVVALNSLASPDKIAPGDVLKLPPPGAGSSAAATAPSSTVSNYTVQVGETLGGIAFKLGISADNQADWMAAVVGLNGLGGPDQLASGQTLKLPGVVAGQNAQAPATTAQKTYIVEDGDTLLLIAGKMGVGSGGQLDWVDSVTRMNTLTSADDLAAGQSLLLPVAAVAASTSASLAVTSPPAPPSTPPSVPAASLPPPAPVFSTPVAASGAALGGPAFTGPATPYSDSLAGNSLGCQNRGVYNPADLTVVAIGPARAAQYPCGTPLQVCGANGCISASRKDSCPGCGTNGIDVSRAAFKVLCGAVNSCQVTVKPAP